MTPWQGSRLSVSPDVPDCQGVCRHDRSYGPEDHQESLQASLAPVTPTPVQTLGTSQLSHAFLRLRPNRTVARRK